MTEPEQNPHTAEPAEGADDPGSGEGGQTPHPQDPAEGADPDAPDAPDA
ncbi:hypothetical protein [Blastococcus sp. CT_GayMR20]|nr:hypothetical protein [Blastococcus sp. CT_GayMR20]